MSCPTIASKAFSLVELLCVIAVIAILTTVSIPALRGRANDMNAGLHVAGGVMEFARQYAISQNTYVWVAVRSSTSGEDGRIAVIASKDGTDLLSWSSASTDVASSTDLELVGPVRTLPRVRVVDAATASIPSMPAVSGAVKMAEVDFQVGSGSGSQNFNRAVQFTPTGEARVTSGVVDRYIDMALLPHQAALTDPNQAVIRIFGLTGKSVVYRN
ncbi:prepilin-type N-terminal cleavage/methylation domain-containing protein [Terrimicrobium sacchariphilum]|jgi:prepilin-type N-terminal cleavage/methylation domain-containing protein|uniref:Prepilin-type N-terminal cleavage/methylation domain-containing protein n=1 Tax=Terrimicrobium sacchariphilum TaxID=690879 RepID=A0A146GDS0_TERSA|nr:prepilin-type N-terminal cleavage/methylation domain-containing protein [Terrimicrobium sacchariphilum]